MNYLWYDGRGYLNERGEQIMEILEIMKQRHSVRQYEERAIEEEVREQLNCCGQAFL